MRRDAKGRGGTQRGAEGQAQFTERRGGTGPNLRRNAEGHAEGQRRR